MRLIIECTLACLLILSDGKVFGLEINEDAFMTVPQLITKYGYLCETHYVTTDDGYILTVFRMKSNNTSETKRQPVLLVHGLFGSSADYIFSGPDKALGYALADNGNDVWLLNCRGTRYSTNHTSIPTWHSNFWNYSWHEIGIYDLPSTIDYILKATKYTQINYVGMSQGTTSFFVMLSEKPEYNKKVKVQVSYAPAVFLCHTTSNVLRMVSRPEEYQMYTNLLKTIGSFDMSPRIETLFLALCPQDKTLSQDCLMLIRVAFDIHVELLEESALETLMGHVPSGTSAKVMVHFAQLVNNCNFKPFQSGDIVPANYNISNIKVPVYAFYGNEDHIVSKKDVKNFKKVLQNDYKKFSSVESFSHSDFIASPNAKEKVYMPTINIINNFIVSMDDSVL